MGDYGWKVLSVSVPLFLLLWLFGLHAWHTMRQRSRERERRPLSNLREGRDWPPLDGR